MGQKRKVDLGLYRNFLFANRNKFSAVELEKVAPDDIAHDAVTRWLNRGGFTPSDLWRQVKSMVDVGSGYLVADDSILDKRFSKKNELAKVQYSGREHGLVNGICLVNLLWTDGEAYVPIDYRVYNDELDDKSKNDHFQEMLKKAETRGFQPKLVLMDSWYGSVSNFKLIHSYGWDWMSNLKKNRKVSVDQGTYVSISDLDIEPDTVQRVWLKEYGFVLVTKTVDPNGNVQYLATSNEKLTNYQKFLSEWKQRWMIETMHRGLKQTTGVANNYARKAEAQKQHIFAAFSAFIKLEKTRLKTSISWYEQKAQLTRTLTRDYLANA